MRPTVLLFNIPEEKHRTIQVLAAQLKLQVRSVKPEQFGTSLEQLLEGGAVQIPTETFAEEMLVMADLPGQVMNIFLLGLRQHKAPVELKAVLTPTNSRWTAVQLYRELCAEREAFRAMQTGKTPGDA